MDKSCNNYSLYLLDLLQILLCRESAVHKSNMHERIMIIIHNRCYGVYCSNSINAMCAIIAIDILIALNAQTVKHGYAATKREGKEDRRMKDLKKTSCPEQS